MAKKKVPEINASSMADISFLLLIFFLVTTTMSVDKGLSRRLPPLPQEKQEQETEVNERNILLVGINSQNNVSVKYKIIDISQLREIAKEFIKNEDNNPDLPELQPVPVDFDGDDIPDETVMVTKNHVISLKNDRGTQYQKYIEVQNELVAAYNELRDEEAHRRFGKPYEELKECEKKGIQAIYPQKISEAEPKNYGGKK